MAIEDNPYVIFRRDDSNGLYARRTTGLQAIIECSAVLELDPKHIETGHSAVGPLEDGSVVPVRSWSRCDPLIIGERVARIRRREANSNVPAHCTAIVDVNE